MLVHNNLELTKRAAVSALAQDVEDTFIVFGDNASTDGARDWCFNTGHFVQEHATNIGVSAAWNAALEWLFAFNETKFVLVCNNDIVLPVWFFRQLLEYDKPFISGVSVDKMEQIAEPAPFGSIHPHPDFSAFLIKREVWEKVGPFDESMKFYASDCAYHVEAHRKGVQLWKANVPFMHERSSTLRLASPEERAEIEEQANKDRAVFQAKYGCMPWGEGYDALFK
jgi:GT2 family glycosyltransferase